MRYVTVPADCPVIDPTSKRVVSTCSFILSVRMGLVAGQQRPVQQGIERMSQRRLMEIEEKFTGALPGDVVALNDDEHALLLEEFDKANPAVFSAAWAWSSPPHFAALKDASTEKPASLTNGLSTNGPTTNGKTVDAAAS